MAGVPPFREAGAGQPLVFLHGWTMDGSIFARQFDRLADEFHCIAPDLPGHGENRSDRPSVELAAAELDALLCAEDLREVILIGWSLGALVGWRHLETLGHVRVSGMMSVDMSPKPVNDGDWYLGLRGLDHAACLATTGRFCKHWRRSVPAIAAGMFARRSGAVDLTTEQAISRIAATDPRAMCAMWESLLAMDLRAAIVDLPVPLLVAHGRASRVYTAATAQWLAATAPRASLREFAASGHSPHLEEPEAFADLVRKFTGTF